VNEKHGSFYLQSKVYRAWEALDDEYTRRGLKPPGTEDPAAAAGAEAQGQQQQQQGQQQSDGSRDEQQR
jgi:import inner membrane translocase subunit TIM16